MAELVAEMRKRGERIRILEKGVPRPSVPGRVGLIDFQLSRLFEINIDLRTGAIRRDAFYRCYERFQLPGVANVRIHIGPTGAVALACVEGLLVDTEEARCVEKMVQQLAHFPATNGTMTIKYPFMLR